MNDEFYDFKKHFVNGYHEVFGTGNLSKKRQSRNKKNPF